MDVRWRRSLLLGAVVCFLLMAAGCAGAGEGTFGSFFTDLCEAPSREGYRDLADNMETMTPDEIRALVAGKAESQDQPVPELSDDEARAMVDRFVVQFKVFPQVIEAWCGLRSEGALPVHGLEFPEHGELTVFGDFRTLAHMREEYDAFFEETLCEEPFGLVMQVVDEKAETRHAHMSLAYIFCGRAGHFELIRAYRESGDAEPVWERFDEVR